jgi:hypothetical protein
MQQHHEDVLPLKVTRRRLEDLRHSFDTVPPASLGMHLTFHHGSTKDFI